MSSFHTELVDRVELVDIPQTQWQTCKSVLRAIGKHANEQEADLAWPGVELLMLYTGASERVIVRTTTLLAKHGWITKKRRCGTSNIYRINVAKLQAHQIARGPAQTVFMARHLKGMAFPGEDLSHLAKKDNPGRSTARKREQHASDQPTRQSGVLVPPIWRDQHANLAGPTRQIGDLVVREESEIQQTDSARELPAGLPAEKQVSNRVARPESPGAALLRGLTISGGAVSAQVVRQHHQAVTELLRTWPAEKLATHLTRETSTGPVANPMGLLVSVLRDTQPLPHAQPRPAPARLTPPCGACDGRPNEPVSTRVLWLDTDKTKSQPCPQCHPAARTPQPTRNAL